MSFITRKEAELFVTRLVFVLLGNGLDIIHNRKQVNSVADTRKFLLFTNDNVRDENDF